MQVGVHLGQRVKGDAGGIHDALHGITFLGYIGMHAGAFVQSGDHVAVGHDRFLQIDAVQQADVVDKAGADGRIHVVFKGGLDAFQVGAQMVTLGGDKPQGAVNVHSGAVHNLIAGGLQNSVGNLAFRHGIVGNCQAVGRRNFPLGIRNRGTGFFQHRLGRVDTGLHILAGVFKNLLAGYVADAFAVDLDVQHKTKPQAVADDDHQHSRRNGGQHVGDGVPEKRVVLADTAAEVGLFGSADLVAAGIGKFLRQFPDVADTGGHAGEGTNQILTESDDAQQDRAQHDHKQVAQSAGNAFDDGVRLAVSAHKNVLDPEAIHVQQVANQVAAGRMSLMGTGGRRPAVIFLFAFFIDLRGIQNLAAPFR